MITHLKLLVSQSASRSMSQSASQSVRVSQSVNHSGINRANLNDGHDSTRQLIHDQMIIVVRRRAVVEFVEVIAVNVVVVVVENVAWRGRDFHLGALFRCCHRVRCVEIRRC